MQNNQPFIGTGKSPDGIDLPAGLSNQLGYHPEAMNTLGNMTLEQKAAAIGYIQSATTGADAKKRIKYAISQLNQGHTSFQ